MIKNIACLFCFSILFQYVFAQGTIKGTIKDNVTQQAIPYPSIGIAGTSLGTLGDANGNFELPYAHNSDTIKISAIGYRPVTMTANELVKNSTRILYMEQQAYELEEIVGEVVVKPKKLGHKILGTAKYSKNICTAFIGENSNWRGEQAAIRANNKEGTTVYLESFSFYIIKNEYTDSLQFRLMLYVVRPPYGYPGKTFLKKPVLFKTNIKQGEVTVDLKDYYINTSEDFFISLECLEEKMEASKFCFAGSVKIPSFVKTTPFGKWTRVKGGGGDFNVKVSYVK